MGTQWLEWYATRDDGLLKRLKEAILAIDLNKKVATTEKTADREDGAVVFAIQFACT